jgi:hypothetical protein
VSSPTIAARQLPALDFIRGCCLLVITINHYSRFAQNLGYTGTQLWTPTNYGYSSSAELFFLISGYLVGAIYARDGVGYPRAFVKLTHRALLLMLYNTLALLLLVVLASALTRPEIEAIELAPLRDTPVQAITDFIFFRGGPPLLDILQMYVCFIVGALVFIPLAKRWPALALALTVGLYLLTQLPPTRDFFADITTAWGMNPYAWQLMFFGGLLIGRFHGLARLDDWLRTPRAFPTVAVVLLAATAVFVADMKLGLTSAPLREKNNLGALRLLHAPVVLCAYWLTAILLENVLSRWGGKWVLGAFSTAGKKSLDNFACGIALSYLGALLLHRAGNQPWAYFGTIGLIVVAFLLIAQHLRWRAQIAQRQKSAVVTQA